MFRTLTSGGWAKQTDTLRLAFWCIGTRTYSHSEKNNSKSNKPKIRHELVEHGPVSMRLGALSFNYSRLQNRKGNFVMAGYLEGSIPKSQ